MQILDAQSDRASASPKQSCTSLEQQVQDWQVLHAMSTGLLKARTLPDQFGVVLATVTAFHGCTQGIVSLHDPERAGLVPQASIGLSPTWLALSACVPVGVGSCGAAFQMATRVIVEDTDTDPLFAPYAADARREHIRALHSTPFQDSRGDPLGVLTIHLGIARRPTERELQLTDICASHIALLVERARSEQRLHAELMRSQDILENMNEGFVLMDSEFCILQINAEGLRIDGRPREELIGRSHWEVWPGSEHVLVGQSYKKAQAERKPVRFENSYRFGDGMKHFTVHAYPYGDGLAVIYRDVSDLKQAYAQLEEAQDRLEATLAAGEVATWIWNIRDDRVWADKNLAALFGFGDGVANGAPMARYLLSVHPDDVAALKDTIDESLAEGRHFQAKYRVRGANGQYRMLLAQGRIERDASGAALRMPGVVLDITRQTEVEKILRVTEERYRTVINSMDDGFCVVEMLFDNANRACDYRFVEANPAFERQTGLQDIVGKRIREIQPDLERKWFDIYGALALAGGSINFTEESPALGRWFDVFATRLGGDNDRNVAVLFTDISERKREDLRLRQQAGDLKDANRRKTEFIATLAHELRNPLAPLRTGLDFMRLAGDMPAAYAKVHDMMDRQLSQMIRLIDDLLDLARINSGKIALRKERVNLRQAIANAVETVLPLVEASHHRLDARMPDAPMFVDADPTRIAQVLGNLLTNAAKYTPPGGTISLLATVASATVRIAISDNGIGISKAAQQELFQIFNQAPNHSGRAQGGLGIGLSLVRSLLHLHGGTVEVESEGEGLGSTFIVELPLIEGVGPAQAAAAALPPEVSSPGKRGIRVLVADDNVDAAQMIQALLEIGGHEVDIVHDGQAALRRATAAQFDLVILDIGMPGMDGHDVARAIGELPGRSRPVLAALTGWGTPEDRVKSSAAGFDAHLTKPAGLAEIEQLVAGIVNRVV